MASKIYDEQFANYADYDCIVQIVFPEVDCFVRMKEDPYYKEFIKPDHDKFADTARSKYVLCQFDSPCNLFYSLLFDPVVSLNSDYLKQDYHWPIRGNY